VKPSLPFCPTSACGAQCQQAFHLRLDVPVGSDQRARSGESKTASRSSVKDVSSGHRGGKRSHSGAQGRTKEQLYNEAKQRGIAGRSSMSKAQLEKALSR
jgi:hypothetical protein